MNATATYTILSSVEAIIEVTYSNGRFGMEKVTITKGSLYEAAYNAASIKAAIHGDRLNRFTEQR